MVGPHANYSGAPIILFQPNPSLVGPHIYPELFSVQWLILHIYNTQHTCIHMVWHNLGLVGFPTLRVPDSAKP